MTIGHILPYVGVGGTELATRRLAEVLDPGEFRSVMFVRRDARPELTRTFMDAGFTTAVYDAVEPSYFRPAAFLRASRALRCSLLQHEVELVHCADLLAAHYCAVAGGMARRPVLCHVRSEHNRISLRDRSFILPVNRFAFVSRQTWRSFGHHVPERKGTVVYDGIAAPAVTHNTKREVLEEFQLPANTRLIGMVSRIAPVKDFETLIRAVGVLEANVRVLAIGEYEDAPSTRAYHDQLLTVIRDLGLSNTFVFTGFRRDIPRLIAALDVMVLSTHSEGLPLVLLEGMAQATPVIATAVGGIPEIITHGQTGLLHEHGDYKDLARQIGSVLTNPALAATLGEAGRRHVEKHFSEEAFAAAMRDLYRSVLSGRLLS